MLWTLEKRKINELRLNEKNPRKLSKVQAEHLQRSMEKFGLCQPIIINCDGTIIGGHQRIRILTKTGHKEVDVYVPDSPLSEKEADELSVRLNKNTGSWDFDLLANQWDPEDLVDWGFSMEELHLESLPPGEAGEVGEERKSPQKCTMTITFKEASHLQEAENKISTIVDEYSGSSYRVRIK